MIQQFLMVFRFTRSVLRPHMALDSKIPADIYRIEIKGKDKWKTLIQNASRIES
jgi:hypothetical protein